MAQPSHPSSSLVDFVPLIRSPATWLPNAVVLPPDIHPLPDDISAYFVYPYSLEQHVLSPQPPHESHAARMRALDDTQAQRVQFLKNREDERTRKKREQLRKVAPGWEPDEAGDDASGDGVLSPGGTAGKRQSGILEPTRKPPTASRAAAQSEEGEQAVKEERRVQAEDKPRDVMDDLVEGLARMDELEGRNET